MLFASVVSATAFVQQALADDGAIDSSALSVNVSSRKVTYLSIRDEDGEFVNAVNSSNYTTVDDREVNPGYGVRLRFDFTVGGTAQVPQLDVGAMKLRYKAASQSVAFANGDAYGTKVSVSQSDQAIVVTVDLSGAFESQYGPIDVTNGTWTFESFTLCDVVKLTSSSFSAATNNKGKAEAKLQYKDNRLNFTAAEFTRRAPDPLPSSSGVTAVTADGEMYEVGKDSGNNLPSKPETVEARVQVDFGKAPAVAAESVRLNYEVTGNKTFTFSLVAKSRKSMGDGGKYAYVFDLSPYCAGASGYAGRWKLASVTFGSGVDSLGSAAFGQALDFRTAPGMTQCAPTLATAQIAGTPSEGEVVQGGTVSVEVSATLPPQMYLYSASVTYEVPVSGGASKKMTFSATKNAKLSADKAITISIDKFSSEHGYPGDWKVVQIVLVGCNVLDGADSADLLAANPSKPAFEDFEEDVEYTLTSAVVKRSQTVGDKKLSDLLDFTVSDTFQRDAEAPVIDPSSLTVRTGEIAKDENGKPVNGQVEFSDETREYDLSNPANTWLSFRAKDNKGGSGLGFASATLYTTEHTDKKTGKPTSDFDDEDGGVEYTTYALDPAAKGFARDGDGFAHTGEGGAIAQDEDGWTWYTFPLYVSEEPDEVDYRDATDQSCRHVVYRLVLADNLGNETVYVDSRYWDLLGGDECTKFDFGPYDVSVVYTEAVGERPVLEVEASEILGSTGYFKQGFDATDKPVYSAWGDDAESKQCAAKVFDLDKTRAAATEQSDVNKYRHTLYAKVHLGTTLGAVPRCKDVTLTYQEPGTDGQIREFNLDLYDFGVGPNADEASGQHLPSVADNSVIRVDQDDGEACDYYVPLFRDNADFQENGEWKLLSVTLTDRFDNSVVVKDLGTADLAAGELEADLSPLSFSLKGSSPGTAASSYAIDRDRCSVDPQGGVSLSASGRTAKVTVALSAPDLFADGFVAADEECMLYYLPEGWQVSGDTDKLPRCSLSLAPAHGSEANPSQDDKGIYHYVYGGEMRVPLAAQNAGTWTAVMLTLAYADDNRAGCACFTNPRLRADVAANFLDEDDFVVKTTGLEALNFEVSKVSLSDEDVRLPANLGIYAYTGGSVALEAEVISLANGEQYPTNLAEGRDYRVAYYYDEGYAHPSLADGIALPGAPTDVGHYRARFEGAGLYDFSVEKAFEITPKTIAECTVGLAGATFAVRDDGGALTPDDLGVSVSDGASVRLVPEVDYKLGFEREGDDGTWSACEAPSEVGTYRAKVTGCGNYQGSKESDEFQLVASGAISVASSEVMVALNKREFNFEAGVEQTPVPTVTLADGTELEQGTDYLVSYENNIDVGQAGDADGPRVIIRGVLGAGYKGVRVEGFTINPAPLEGCSVSAGSLSYTGHGQAPVPSVWDGDGVLVPAERYTVWAKPHDSEAAYERVDEHPIVAAGTYDLVVRGRGNYSGETHPSQFTMRQATLTGSTAVVSYDYANRADEHGGYSVRLTPGNAALSLVPYEDWAIDRVVDPRGEEHKLGSTDWAPGEVGKYVAVIQGRCNVQESSEIRAVFYAKGDIEQAGIRVGDPNWCYYSGNPVLPKNIEVTLGETTLKEGEDYYVQYAKSGVEGANLVNAPVEVGAYDVHVIGKGAYAGEDADGNPVLREKVAERAFEVRKANLDDPDLPVEVGMLTAQYADDVREAASGAFVSVANSNRRMGGDECAVSLERVYAAQQPAGPEVPLAEDGSLPVGEYRCTLHLEAKAGSPNCEGARTVEGVRLVVKPASVENVAVADEGLVFACDGNPHEVNPTITYKGKQLVAGEDYELVGYAPYDPDDEFEGLPTEYGRYTFTIRGLGANFAGTRTCCDARHPGDPAFKLTLSLSGDDGQSNCWLVPDLGDTYSYAGSGTVPTPDVYVKDFSVRSYPAKPVVDADGNVPGYVLLDPQTQGLFGDGYTAQLFRAGEDGSWQKLPISLNELDQWALMPAGQTLTPGRYKLIFAGAGAYVGQVEREFEVVKADLSLRTAVWSDGDAGAVRTVTFDGEPFDAAPEVDELEPGAQFKHSFWRVLGEGEEVPDGAQVMDLGGRTCVALGWDDDSGKPIAPVAVGTYYAVVEGCGALHEGVAKWPDGNSYGTVVVEPAEERDDVTFGDAVDMDGLVVQVKMGSEAAIDCYAGSGVDVPAIEYRLLSGGEVASVSADGRVAAGKDAAGEALVHVKVSSPNYAKASEYDVRIVVLPNADYLEAALEDAREALDAVALVGDEAEGALLGAGEPWVADPEAERLLAAVDAAAGMLEAWGDEVSAGDFNECYRAVRAVPAAVDAAVQENDPADGEALDQLDEALAAASSTADGVVLARSAADVPRDKRWATPEAFADLETARSAAASAAGASAPSTGAIAAALRDLEAAADRFAACVQSGSAPTQEDLAAAERSKTKLQNAAAARSGKADANAFKTATGKGSKLKVRISGTSTAVVGLVGSAPARLSLGSVKLAGGKSRALTSVGKGAFRGAGMKSVVVGGKVASIGARAFAGCKSLKSVTLGAKVKNVGKAAFKGAAKLKTVTLKTARLTKASCANIVKGSKVKTVVVKVKGGAKAKKQALQKYKRYFSKKAVGRSVRVRLG